MFFYCYLEAILTSKKDPKISFEIDQIILTDKENFQSFIPEYGLIKNGDFERPLDSIGAENSWVLADEKAKIIYDFYSPSGYAYLDISERKSTSSHSFSKKK